MTWGFATSLRTARAQKIIDAIDAGTGAGKIKFYTGTRPATGAAITSQTLLGTVPLNDPCGAAANGAIAWDVDPVPEDASADNTGTAAWARLLDSDDNFVADCSVTATGGGGDITLNSTAIVAGGPIRITGGTLTEGDA